MSDSSNNSSSQSQPCSPQSLPTSWAPPNLSCGNDAKDGSVQIGFSKFSWTDENGTYAYSWDIPMLGVYSWQACSSTPRTKICTGEFHLLEEADVSWEIDPEAKTATVTYGYGNGEQYKELTRHDKEYAFPNGATSSHGTYGKVGEEPVLTTSVDWGKKRLILTGMLGFTPKTVAKQKTTQETTRLFRHKVLEKWD